MLLETKMIECVQKQCNLPSKKKLNTVESISRNATGNPPDHKGVKKI